MGHVCPLLWDIFCIETVKEKKGVYGIKFVADWQAMDDEAKREHAAAIY